MTLNEIKEGHPDWKVVAYARLEERINCASCGREVTFGDAYTSRVHETDIGMGLAICGHCSEKEIRNWIEQSDEQE